MGNVDKDINQHNAGWSFDHISEDFDSHIQRSIPLYQEGHELICQYSDFFSSRTALSTISAVPPDSSWQSWRGVIPKRADCV